MNLNTQVSGDRVETDVLSDGPLAVVALIDQEQHRSF
jgi:hypothetical protein